MPSLREEATANAGRKYSFKAAEVIAAITDPAWRDEVYDLLLGHPRINERAASRTLKKHGIDLSAEAIRNYRAAVPA